MTNLEKIRQSVNSDNIDELIDFILSTCETYDTAAWTVWFDKNYCHNCESIKVYVPAFDKEADCAYCELSENNYGCKYLDGKECDDRIVMKLWLNAEAEE